MPYIGKEARVELNVRTDRDIKTVGELNFCITRLVDGFLGPDPTYTDFNDVVGALECAKMELYRRAAVPYEDKKREENTDVYRVR